MNNVRGYIFSRSFMGERAPQHIQNIIIRDYCAKKNLNFLLSATEYAMEGCDLILKEVLMELRYIEGIVMYSLFQLPEDTRKRQGVYKQIIALNKPIYFAVENLSIHNELDVERVEKLWLIKKTMLSNA